MRVLIPVLGAVALAGCVPSSPGSPTPTTTVVPASPSPTLSPSPSQTPTPTPSPTAFASFPATLPTEDPVTAAVIAGWQEYWRVYEKFSADPGGFKDLTETQYVTTGEQSVTILDEMAQIREAGLRSDGGRQFRDIVVTVTEGPPKTAVVRYCMVLDALRVVDAGSGERVVRSGTVLERDTLEEMPDGTWRVAQIRNEVAAC